MKLKEIKKVADGLWMAEGENGLRVFHYTEEDTLASFEREKDRKIWQKLLKKKSCPAQLLHQ